MAGKTAPTFECDGHIVCYGSKIRKGHKGTCDFYTVNHSSNGRRTRKNFQSLQDAKLFAERLSIEVQRLGVAVFQIDDALRLDAVKASKLLHGQITLEECAQYWLARNAVPDDGLTLRDAVDALHVWMTTTPLKLKSTKGGGYRRITTESCRRKLEAFSSTVGDNLPVVKVTKELTEDWTKSVPLQTAKTTLRFVSLLWTWATREQMIPATLPNPTQGIRLVENHKMPEIYTPKEIESIIRHMAGNTRKAGLIFTILSAFCGLRPFECYRLLWRDVDIDLGEIHIRSEVSKTHQARIISIPANAKRWLAPYVAKQGTQRVVSSESAVKRARESCMNALGMKWIQDGLRHSFATYSCAKYGFDHTADALGHIGGTSVLIKHYKGLASNRAKQADKYFAIMPTSSQIIQLQRVGA